MRRSKDQIEEELLHKKRLINALDQRRRPLEVQAAQKGSSAPPEILTEISSLTEQVRAITKEISDLETFAAEGQLSIVEAEYRYMIAKAWDTPRGRPTLVGSAEIELARLRMGIVLESAKAIESEVRVLLSEEAFSELDADFIENLPKIIIPSTGSVIQFGAGNQIGDITIGDIVAGNTTYINLINQANPYYIGLRVIGKAIRLDVQIALRLLVTILPSSSNLDVEKFSKELLNANRVWNFQDDKDNFEGFIIGLVQALREDLSTSE